MTHIEVPLFFIIIIVIIAFILIEDDNNYHDIERERDLEDISRTIKKSRKHDE